MNPLVIVNMFLTFVLAFATYVVTASWLWALAYAVVAWFMLGEAAMLLRERLLGPFGRHVPFGVFNTLPNMLINAVWIVALVFPYPGKRLLIIALAAAWFAYSFLVGHRLWIVATRTLCVIFAGQVSTPAENTFRPYGGALTSIPRILIALCLMQYGSPLVAKVFGQARFCVWLIPGSFAVGVLIALIALRAMRK